MASTRASARTDWPSPTRRQHIVDAATRLFAATRYDAVQIDDVAHAAGVAKPTLYRYFATKEDLFVEMLDALLGEVADELALIVEAGGGATEALQEMICVLLERIGGKNFGVRVFDGSEKRFGRQARARLRARTKQIRGSLAAALSYGMDQREFRDVDPDLVALAIIGSLGMVAAKIPRRRRAAAARTMTDLLIGGIVSDAARETFAPPLQAVARIDALDVG